MRSKSIRRERDRRERSKSLPREKDREKERERSKSIPRERGPERRRSASRGRRKEPSASPPKSKEATAETAEAAGAADVRKSRSKSAPRSRSNSPTTLGVKMPHNQASTGERIEAEVIERPALRSGEPVWQAEIIMSQGTQNHAGQRRKRFSENLLLLFSAKYVVCGR